MKTLAIIPARGGSKGVYKKNIKLLLGRPLIAYSIDVAKESKLLTNFIVSTDCNEIKKVSESYGANVFKRSPEFAADSSSIDPVIKEVLEHENYKNYELIILLQPTAPIRDGFDIDNVINMFKDDYSLQSVVSLVELEDIHPARMYSLSDTSQMTPLYPKQETKRRQELKKVYLRNGAIYAIRASKFLENNKLIVSSKKGYVMKSEKWINLDTERDFMVAEVMVSEWLKSKIE